MVHLDRIVNPLHRGRPQFNLARVLRSNGRIESQVCFPRSWAINRQITCTEVLSWWAGHRSTWHLRGILVKVVTGQWPLHRQIVASLEPAHMPRCDDCRPRGQLMTPLGVWSETWAMGTPHKMAILSLTRSFVLADRTPSCHPVSTSYSRMTFGCSFFGVCQHLHSKKKQ